MMEIDQIIKELAELKFEMKVLSKQFDVLVTKYSETKINGITIKSAPAMQSIDPGFYKDLGGMSLVEPYAGDYENPETLQPIDEVEPEGVYPKFYVRNGTIRPDEDVKPKEGPQLVGASLTSPNIPISAMWDAAVDPDPQENSSVPWDEPPVTTNKE